MKFTIDVDTGGTFTDGFFTKDGQIKTVKVDTTPHDLTVCFINCIRAGAEKFGVSIQQLLQNMEVIRLSTTIGSNTLINKSGPKLGLIVTNGFTDSLYGDSTVHNPLFDYMISRNMVIGIDTETNTKVQREKYPLEEKIKAAVKRLLEGGSRIIIVSLGGAGLDDYLERMVKNIVASDYPRHYLGAVPILLSTEVSHIEDDAIRTNSAVVNAYLHREQARFLYKADEDLFNAGYRKPLLVAHSGGGVARVAKTKAIQTLDSGPTCGLSGATFMSKLYNNNKVVTLDIGGTSTDIGFVIDGTYNVNDTSVHAGIRIYVPNIEVEVIAGGGGSIARPVLGSKTVQMGPESAGALPGPACYDLGGTEATATDACVVLGYIDPSYFLGGRRKLNHEKAWESIANNVAKPLGLKVNEAAYGMVKSVESMVAQQIKGLLSKRNMAPQDFELFAFGGAGGLFCTGIATQLGIPKIYSFPTSSVFSAFGSSTFDVSHHYESTIQVILPRNSLVPADRINELNRMIQKLKDIALRDMRGEGFESEKVSFILALRVTGASGPSIIQLPPVMLKGKQDIETIYESYPKTTGACGGDLVISQLRLVASAPVPHHKFISYEPVKENPQDSYKGKRTIYWVDNVHQANTYEKSHLQCGNVVTGPAIIDSEDTSVLVPSGWKYTVDKFLTGIIQPLK